jgi:hypothetical protein
VDSSINDVETHTQISSARRFLQIHLVHILFLRLLSLLLISTRRNMKVVMNQNVIIFTFMKPDSTFMLVALFLSFPVSNECAAVANTRWHIIFLNIVPSM